MKKTYLSLFLGLFCLTMLSCVSTKNISSFECSYEQNGGNRPSESIILRPIITTTKGVQLIPQDQSSTQLISRYDNRTSKTLKEYKIEVIGGTRIGTTGVIEINKDVPEKINKRLQVFVSVKKDPDFVDTIDYIIDYQGRLSLNFDASNPGVHANDVFVNVSKIEDSTYYSIFKCDLYKVVVSHGNSSEAYFMSEKNASLFVSNNGANGSSGANGANGKNGSPGKDGMDGFKGKDGEAGGTGTDGGNGGNGGNGGRLVITIDADCSQFKNLVSNNNQGGNGGNGGKGGVGGAGGKGGLGGHRIVGGNVLGERKSSGNTGSAGANGRDGRNGVTGEAGSPIEFITIN